jgi:osmotically-inducible protein OsmY
VADRSAEQIQRDIEQARAGLADAVDQLAYRTNPRRVTDNAKQALLVKANTPQGRIVIGVSGGLVLLLIVRRFRKR